MSEETATPAAEPTPEATPQEPQQNLLQDESSPSEQSSILNDSGEFVEGWNSAFDDLKDVNLSKFKTPDALAKSYVHLERQKGAAYYPQEGWNDDKVQAYRDAAGVPASPEEYQIKPEALPDGIEWDESYASKVQDIAHKHHIPARALHDLVQLEMGHRSEMLGQIEQSREEARVGAESELKEIWGVKYQQNLENAKQAFVELSRHSGFSEDEANEMAATYGNDPKLLRFFASVGSQVREAAIHGAHKSAPAAYEGDREKLGRLIGELSKPENSNNAAMQREMMELSKKISSSGGL